MLRKHFGIPYIHNKYGLLLLIKTINELDSLLDMNESVCQFLVFQKRLKCP